MRAIEVIVFDEKLFSNLYTENNKDLLLFVLRKSFIRRSILSHSNFDNRTLNRSLISDLLSNLWLRLSIENKVTEEATIPDLVFFSDQELHWMKTE